MGDVLEDLVAPRWLRYAVCGDVDDPDVFFPERGDSTGAREAKMICARCPVRSECLDHALSLSPRPSFGIWGGLSEMERRVVWRARRARRNAA